MERNEKKIRKIKPEVKKEKRKCKIFTSRLLSFELPSYSFLFLFKPF